VARARELIQRGEWFRPEDVVAALVADTETTVAAIRLDRR